jgi:signal transduction histidine kinase
VLPLRSSYPYLKLFTILFPPILIGGAEVIRHEWWVNVISIEAGNLLIAVIALALSLWYAEWMFRRIEASNARLAEEQARRAVYEERERLAGELHDNIAQGLFFLNVKLQKGHTEEAKSAVAEINNHLRQSIFNLRSLPEETADFEDRLRRWLEEWSAISGIRCRIRIEAASADFSTAEEVQLFGLIQEAFTNIRKHSRADHAGLELLAGPDQWQLTVTDNGTGIPQEVMMNGLNGSGPVSVHRYGLLMMAKRAEALHAGFSISRPEQGGTVLRVISRNEVGEG